MNVLSICLTYPTADWPARGVFVQRRLDAMAEFMNVRVIAPRPWFPFFPPAPRGEPPHQSIDTRRPRMFYLPGFLKPMDPWFYSRVLLREIRALRPIFAPDLIDAHYEWPDGAAAAWAARRLDIPFVITLRGKLTSQSQYPVRRRQMRDMLRAAAARIAVSRDLARRAAALAGDGRAITVIPNGIDAARFRPRDRQAMRRALGLEPHARYIVSVGYVQETKGFHRIVEVLAGVRGCCGDVRLLLVGDEVGEHDYVRRLHGAIASSGAARVIHRICGATPDEIAMFLNAADLFVLPTRAEGWCNAIHESLACGTPVVTTHVGGNPELVRAGDDGMLVPFGDSAALAASIAAALDRDWDRDAVAARASARTWRTVATEVCDVFRNVLSRRHGPIPLAGNPDFEPAGSHAPFAFDTTAAGAASCERGT